MVLEKILESPLHCKDIQPVHSKGNQSRVSTGRLMLKVQFQYFGHLMRRVDPLEETLMLGGIGDRKKRGQQRMRWLDGITDSMDMSLGVGDGQGGLVCCAAWACKELDTTEQLN